MSEFTPLREAVDTLAGRTQSPDFGELERRAARRGRRRVVMVAAATAAVVAASVLATKGFAEDRRTAPVEQPEPVVGAVPVWYDAKGLHRGDVVEQTAVNIVVPEQVVDEDSSIPQKGALALVRSGAVYLDPATGDVWFHPWGGEPGVIGHNSAAGPGGDPNGDTAAWFEGSDAWDSELVVYDTAAGREISRTLEGQGVTDCRCGDHYPAGNGFLQVSTEHVVWISDGAGVYSHDLRTQSTSEVTAPKEHYLADVHDDVVVLGDSSFNLVLSVPGRAEEHYPNLEDHVRLSPSGGYVLAVEDTEDRHGAAIVDTRTGELWRVPENVYPLIAWSYGDIAMVDTEDELLACNAARRACEPLPAEHPLLLPTN